MKLNSEHLFELATPSRIFFFPEISEMLKENRLEKLVSLVKWSP